MALNYTININGRLLDLGKVRVMGILNVTEDSFFEGSRCNRRDDIVARTIQMLSEGADIIDIGACSTRPGARSVDEMQEYERLRDALKAVREIAPDTIISVDTFRAGIARMAVEEFGVAIVNDVSAGAFDPTMIPVVAKLGVPYVLTHGCPQPEAAKEDSKNLFGSACLTSATANPVKQEETDGDIVESVMRFFAEKVQLLRDLGHKDIIIDPGFGFGKTLDENYRLLANISVLKQFDLPILIGVSRKSMIYKLLKTTPDKALNGSTVIHTTCLLQQACNILRVHDVRPAREAVTITEKILQQNQKV